MPEQQQQERNNVEDGMVERVAEVQVPRGGIGTEKIGTSRYQIRERSVEGPRGEGISRETESATTTKAPEPQLTEEYRRIDEKFVLIRKATVGKKKNNKEILDKTNQRKESGNSEQDTEEPVTLWPREPHVTRSRRERLRVKINLRTNGTKNAFYISCTADARE